VSLADTEHEPALSVEHGSFVHGSRGSRGFPVNLLDPSLTWRVNDRGMNNATVTPCEICVNIGDFEAAAPHCLCRDV